MDLSEVEKLDAPAKVLKLSTAMRIGCLIRPKVEGDLFFGGGSCALGAAYEGATGKKTTQYRPIFNLWPELESKSTRDRFSRLAIRIAEANDGGESRESIADRLESQGY